MKQHYNKFNGKFYNYYDVYIMDGPDGKYLRKYVQRNICIHGIPKYILNNILKKYIPDNKDYGTWQGFDIFGLNYKFYIDINKEIKKYRKSIKIIEKKFIPIWLEKAYRFEGCMYIRVKNRTYIGKTVSKI